MYADTCWVLYRMSITPSNTEEQAFFSSSIAFSKRWLVKKELQKTEIYVGNLNTVKKCWFHFGVGCLFFFFWWCVCVCWVYLGWLIFLLVMFPSTKWLWLKQIRKKRTKGPCCSLQPVLTLSIRCSQQRNAYFTHNLVLQQMSIFFLQDIWMYIRKYIW